MKIVSLAAAAAVSLAPALAMAQSCPPGWEMTGEGDTLVCLSPEGNTLSPGATEGTLVDQYGNVYQVEGGRLVGADATVYIPQPDGTLVVSVAEGGVAGAPLAFGEIPAGAMVVGGLVLLSGLIIGIVAATDDDEAVTTITTTTTN